MRDSDRPRIKRRDVAQAVCGAEGVAGVRASSGIEWRIQFTTRVAVRTCGLSTFGPTPVLWQDRLAVALSQSGGRRGAVRHVAFCNWRFKNRRSHGKATDPRPRAARAP